MDLYGFRQGYYNPWMACNYSQLNSLYLNMNNEYFEKASEKKESNEIALKALYWQAQSDYQYNDFTGALALFDRFSQQKTAQNLKEWKALNYNRGYAHFKLKQYSAAIEAFEKQERNVELLSKELRRDLYMRFLFCQQAILACYGNLQ